MSIFAGKTLMITGGTGSFGNAVLNRFLRTDIGEIRIFSRDEKKQDDMRHKYQAKYPDVASKIKFYIGDVRDLRSCRNAMPGVDYIFHAAALKQVPIVRVLPDVGCQDQCDRNGQCTYCRHRGRRGCCHLSLHRQGGLSHQRHGHFQSYRGEDSRGQEPLLRQDQDMLHTLWQRDVLTWFCYSSLD